MPLSSIIPTPSEIRGINAKNSMHAPNTALPLFMQLTALGMKQPQPERIIMKRDHIIMKIITPYFNSENPNLFETSEIGYIFYSTLLEAALSTSQCFKNHDELPDFLKTGVFLHFYFDFPDELFSCCH